MWPQQTAIWLFWTDYIFILLYTLFTGIEAEHSNASYDKQNLHKHVPMKPSGFERQLDTEIKIMKI